MEPTNKEKLTPKQKKRLERIIDIIKKGELGIAKYLFDIEEKVDEEIELKREHFNSQMEVVKGIAKDAVSEIDELDKERVKRVINAVLEEIPKPENGKDYVLTSEDKKEIASKIEVPVVEKIIEKTEVIHEQPIVTNEVKEIVKETEKFNPEILGECGEYMKEGLESLTGDKRLDRKAIKGLDEALEKMSQPESPKGGGWRTLFQLHDVTLGEPTNGQALVYNSDTGQWENGDVSVSMSDTAYDATSWNGNTDGATKNAIRDKIESIMAGTGMPEVIMVAVSDETTDLTIGTAKITFRMPYAMTLSAVRASVNTAPTGATVIVDINEGGSTILSTKLSIDISEKTSTTAGTPAVISDTALADDAEITIDIDQIGSTIAGKGLKVSLIGTRT